MRFFASFGSLILFCSAGCASDDLAGPPPGGDGMGGGGSAPIFESADNLILVREIAALGEPTVTVSRVYPSFGRSRWDLLVETAREGRCRLLESEVSRCEDCQGGFCVGGECRTSPGESPTAGDIQVDGLSLEVKFDDQGYGYDNVHGDAAVDLFEAGALVTASASGDEIPAFSVSARAVSAAQPTMGGECQNEILVADDGSATVTWADPDPSARARLWMATSNNGHGLPPRAVVECEGPDAGEFHVPASVLAGFEDAPRGPHCGRGWVTACTAGSDCGPYTITRYRDGRVTIGLVSIVLRIEAGAEVFLGPPDPDYGSKILPGLSR